MTENMIVRKVGKWGTSLAIPLTGFVKHGENFSVEREGDIITLRKVYCKVAYDPKICVVAEECVITAKHEDVNKGLSGLLIKKSDVRPEQ